MRRWGGGPERQAGPPQRAGAVSLTHQLLPHAEVVHPALLDGDRLQLDVRDHADPLDRAVTGGEILGDCDLETRAVAVGVDHLHRALSVGALADDHRPVQVLQGPRHYLRGAGRSRVHQHDQGHLAHEGAPPVGAALPPLDSVLNRGDDGARVQEGVRHVDGPGEQPTAVAAKVQHHPLHAAPLEGLEGQAQLPAGGCLEALDLEVAHGPGEHPVVHSTDADPSALDYVPPGLAHPLALDPDAHLRAGAATEALHRLVQRQVQGGLALNADDLVASLQARLGRGGAGQRLYNREHLGMPAAADGDPQTAEGPAGVDLHLAEELRPEQHRVAVQRLEHSVHRRVLHVSPLCVAVQVGVHEPKNPTQRGGERPGAVDLLQGEGTHRLVHLHLHAVSPLHANDHLGHVLLDLQQSLAEHLAGIQPPGLHVPGSNLGEHVVEHAHLHQVVLALGLPGTSCLGGNQQHSRQDDERSSLQETEPT